MTPLGILNMLNSLGFRVTERIAFVPLTFLDQIDCVDFGEMLLENIVVLLVNEDFKPDVLLDDTRLLNHLNEN